MPKLTADFDTAEPAAVEDYTIDFTGYLPIGGALDAATWGLTAKGALPGYTLDATPNSHLQGTPALASPKTTQRISGLVAGNDYLVSAAGTMSDGEIIVLWTYLRCRSPGA